MAPLKNSEITLRKLNMKNWISIVVVVCMLAMPMVTNAQTNKFGHVNIQELLTSMPGYKDAEKQLQKLTKDMQDAYLAMQEEYQKKMGELQAMETDPGANDVLKENKYNELVDLEKRMQRLELSSEEKLMQRQTELLKPIEDQILKAVKELANEGGYTYIFDSSMGTLLHYPEGDNVLPQLKKKLGLQ